MFYTFTSLLPDREQIREDAAGKKNKTQSTKRRVQNQLSSNRAFSQFVSSPPSHLFVFLPRSLSQPLVSSSVGQSVCSEVFISAAGLPSCTNGYLRSCAPLSVLPHPPPSSFQQSSSSFPKTSSLPPTALSSLFLLSFNLAPVLIHPLYSPSMLLPTIRPFSSSSDGYLVTISEGRMCSVEHHAGLIWSGTNQPVWVCVCHLVTTVPSSGGSWTNIQLEIWEALEQLSESERHTERHGAHSIAHTSSHRNTTARTLFLSSE